MGDKRFDGVRASSMRDDEGVEQLGGDVEKPFGSAGSADRVAGRMSTSVDGEVGNSLATGFVVELVAFDDGTGVKK